MAPRWPLDRRLKWLYGIRKLPIVDKGVLGVLNYHADGDTLTCWPSLHTISQEAGCSRSTAVEALKRLEQAGLIERTVRHGKGIRRSPTLYRLNIPTSPGAGQVVQPLVREPDITSPGAGPITSPGAGQEHTNLLTDHLTLALGSKSKEEENQKVMEYLIGLEQAVRHR